MPTVLSKTEVNQVLSGIQGLHQLMARLLYGCGLRLMECLCLRAKDIDFEQSQVVVREGKGEKDRLTMLPASLVEPLNPQRMHRYGSLDAPLWFLGLEEGLGKRYKAEHWSPEWELKVRLGWKPMMWTCTRPTKR